MRPQTKAKLDRARADVEQAVAARSSHLEQQRAFPAPNEVSEFNGVVPGHGSYDKVLSDEEAARYAPVPDRGDAPDTVTPLPPNKETAIPASEVEEMYRKGYLDGFRDQRKEQAPAAPEQLRTTVVHVAAPAPAPQVQVQPAAQQVQPAAAAPQPDAKNLRRADQKDAPAPKPKRHEHHEHHHHKKESLLETDSPHHAHHSHSGHHSHSSHHTKASKHGHHTVSYKDQDGDRAKFTREDGETILYVNDERLGRVYHMEYSKFSGELETGKVINEKRKAVMQYKVTVPKKHRDEMADFVERYSEPAGSSDKAVSKFAKKLKKEGYEVQDYREARRHGSKDAEEESYQDKYAKDYKNEYDEMDRLESKRRSKAERKFGKKEEEEIERREKELPDFERQEIDNEPEDERLADAKELEDDVEGRGPLNPGEIAVGKAERADDYGERRVATERKMDLMDSVMDRFEKARETEFKTDDSGRSITDDESDCVMKKCSHMFSQCALDASCEHLMSCLSENQGVFEDASGGSGKIESPAVEKTFKNTAQKCENSAKAEHGELSYASHKLLDCTQQCGQLPPVE